MKCLIFLYFSFPSSWIFLSASFLLLSASFMSWVQYIDMEGTIFQADLVRGIDDDTSGMLSLVYITCKSKKILLY